MFLEGAVDWVLILVALAVFGHVLALVAIGFALSRQGRLASISAEPDFEARAREAAETRLHETLNAIPVALVQTNARGELVFANRSAQKMIGRSEAELIGLGFHAATWGITDPDGRTIPPDRLPSARALRGQPVRDFQHLLANPATHRKMLLSVTAMPIEAEQGGIVGSVAILNLIETARAPGDQRADVKIAGPAREIGLAELERAAEPSRHLETVGRLTGGLAQDFNALLAVMTSALDMMLKTVDDPARVRRLGQAALAAGRRGEVLTRRLSAFSQGEDAPAPVLDAAVLLRAMESRLRALAGPGVELSIQGPSEAAPVRVDPVGFESVIHALVRNAVEAMGGAGSMAVRLEIMVDGGVRLTVRDTGPGLDATTAARALEPFFTTRDGAAGLGLAQVHAFARRSGGTLTLTGAEGEGAEATLMLPAAVASTVA